MYNFFPLSSQPIVSQHTKILLSVSSITFLGQATRKITQVTFGLMFCSFIKLEEMYMMSVRHRRPSPHAIPVSQLCQIFFTSSEGLSPGIISLSPTYSKKKKKNPKPPMYQNVLPFTLELETSFQKAFYSPLVNLQLGPNLLCIDSFGQHIGLKLFKPGCFQVCPIISYDITHSEGFISFHSLLCLVSLLEETRNQFLQTRNCGNQL